MSGDVNRVLAQCSLNGSPFTVIHLSQRGIDDQKTQVIVETLESPLFLANLVQLVLSYNRIQDIGAQTLANALKAKNCKILELDVSHNAIGDLGAKVE